MKTNRRKFLKHSGLAGIGLIGASIIPAFSSGKDNHSDESGTARIASTAHQQKFNMSGYSAPKIDTVRIGFIGLGKQRSRSSDEYESP